MFISNIIACYFTIPALVLIMNVEYVCHNNIVFSSFLNLHHLNIQLAMLCVKDKGQEVNYDMI